MLRYVCRAGCHFIPCREDQWFLCTTASGKEHWHCPGCGSRYNYAAIKANQPRGVSQLMLLDMPNDRTLLKPQTGGARAGRSGGCG